jgi:Flp pilus assembly protein TadG
MKRIWWRNQQRTEGQSLVEMSFVLPFLLILFFGIIDLGYFIYCYGAVHQAVRRGSTSAAVFPPYASQFEDGTFKTEDLCVQQVINTIQKGAVLVDYSDIATNRSKFGLAYRDSPSPAAEKDNKKYRDIGHTVEVTMSYTVEPLTPLMSLIPVFGKHGITIQASSMRTIISLGNKEPPDGVSGTLIICKEE